MLKHLRKTFLIFYSVCILFSNFAFAEIEIPETDGTVSDNSQMELIQNDIKVDDLDIEPINTQELKKSVIPDTSKESKKVIGLFLKTMMGVIFCAVFLYFILFFTKKFYKSAFVSNDCNDEIKTLDLATPDNKQDALKSFLDKSK